MWKRNSFQLGVPFSCGACAWSAAAPSALRLFAATCWQQIAASSGRSQQKKSR